MQFDLYTIGIRCRDGVETVHREFINSSSRAPSGSLELPAGGSQDLQTASGSGTDLVSRCLKVELHIHWGNPCAINFTIHANVVPHYDHLLCSLSALFAARATQRMLEGRIFLETAQCTIFVKIHLQINFFQPQSSSTTMGDLWIFIFLK